MTTDGTGRHTKTWEVGNWCFYIQLVDRRLLSMLTIRTTPENPHCRRMDRRGSAELDTLYQKFPISNPSAFISYRLLVTFLGVCWPYFQDWIDLEEAGKSDSDVMTMFCILAFAVAINSSSFWLLLVCLLLFWLDPATDHRLHAPTNTYWNAGLWGRHDQSAWLHGMKLSCIFVGQRWFPFLFLICHHLELN